MAISKRDWPKQTWKYPLPHDFTWSFGLGMDNASTKNSTIVPYLFQDNAIVDYETIKTNPQNEDFAVKANANCASGSYIPRCMVSWAMFSTSSEITIAKVHTMNIHTSMLNRLDAFDKKTGNDIETILELQHETTDEQAGALYNATKLFEGHHNGDLPFPDTPFLTTTGQLEQVAFDMELFFDALHYYTNKEMLRQVTERMKTHLFGNYSEDVPISNRIIRSYRDVVPSMCKFQHPYTYCGELFHVPLSGTKNQFLVAGGTTNLEHVTVMGRVRFNEFNPDFNFARA